MSMQRITIANAYAYRPGVWGGRIYGQVPFTLRENFAYPNGDLATVSGGRWAVGDSFAMGAATDLPQVVGNVLTGPAAYTAGSTQKWLELTSAARVFDGLGLPPAARWDAGQSDWVLDADVFRGADNGEWSLTWDIPDAGGTQANAKFLRVTSTDASATLQLGASWSGGGGVFFSGIAAMLAGRHNIKVTYVAATDTLTGFINGVLIGTTLAGHPANHNLGAEFAFNSTAGHTQSGGFFFIRLAGKTVAL